MLGGFLDEGEDPLAGLRRELLEETGVEIEPDGYLGTFVDTYGDGPTATYVLNLAWRARIVDGELAPADDVSDSFAGSRPTSCRVPRSAPSAGSRRSSRVTCGRLPESFEWGTDGPVARPIS